MASDSQDIAALRVELAQLTAKVDAISRHLGLGQLPNAGTPTEPWPDVVELIQRGNTIQAIKLWRERTGAGLAESKHAVEDLARRLGH